MQSVQKQDNLVIGYVTDNLIMQQQDATLSFRVREIAAQLSMSTSSA